MTTVAHQPLQTLIEDLWQSERQRAEEQTTSINAIEEAMTVLDDWSQRLEALQANQNAGQEATDQEKEAERVGAEELRKRLEHDLVTARERVDDLQSSLQERTEELLKAQAANNELSAELQAVNDALPLGVPPTSGPVETKPTDKELSSDSSEGKSVSERFGQLRKKN